MEIPNDLPEDGTRYYREYVKAGGPDHAARAYAIACCQRDNFAARLEAITSPEDAEPQGEGDAINVQIMWAVQKSWVEANKLVEKLREQLPVQEPEQDDDTGYFKP